MTASRRVYKPPRSGTGRPVPERGIRTPQQPAMNDREEAWAYEKITPSLQNGELGGNEERHQVVEEFFCGRNIFQILDGFVLAASTDGTLLYASDNVLQYLGFNQVDLMHRCLYGIVHPDDHDNMKNVLERHITSVTQISDNFQSKTVNISFVCRMKCFNGTSAGYLKIHCSGKIEDIPEFSLKNSRNQPHIMLLFCQPFMLTGNDLTNDVKQNVFWSKHDMDLTIRELDKKASDIIGYNADELNEVTLYKYVHPEDLVTFAACHKTLMDSTEVQTMYFRIETRNGKWVWLHSRGKVISKNSKKFSIVFTHCPVRVEDSTFLQQETALRHRYAIGDLQFFLQNGHYSNGGHRSDPENHNEDIHGMQKVSNFCTPHMGFTEDVSLSFYTPLVTCPSSWHMMSDRHSPVLPSTHVAHKITQREKQLQFQEFKRRQQIEKTVIKSEYSMYNPVQNSCQQYVASSVDSFTTFKPCSNGTQMIKAEPQENFYTTCGHTMNYPNSMLFNPMEQTPQQQWNAAVPPNYSAGPPNVNVYNFPPSPPYSPQKVANYSFNQHIYPQQGHNPTNLTCVHQPMQTLPDQFDRSQNSAGFANYHNLPISHVQNQYFSNGCVKPDRGVKFSVRCNASEQNSHFSPQGSNFGVFQNASNIAITTIAGPSCAMPHRFCPDERVEYDIEASIHMKIVENPRNRRGTHQKGDVDLPSIGSFLEYLNDS
ncbi:neuronal PAS domain-containing protein 3-like [Saccostrea echinata]|uniref:neuronal PAS domain-containing protein 3-like n=1 Tax=Saccostrea echinata TaxID=191078 RepID=UPI002A83B8D1|nr:neuronal PAS domain-containing protein 3-like [Saccostrea echinata]